MLQDPKWLSDIRERVEFKDLAFVMEDRTTLLSVIDRYREAIRDAPCPASCEWITRYYFGGSCNCWKSKAFNFNPMEKE